jgi:phosphoribosylformimino-5-aminoimidazole carboxamide ribonucleotide (ProFAR) isomerase
VAGLTGIGVEGAIVGTALYSGSLAIGDALAAAPGR